MKNILIVDDDELVREIMLHDLQDNGYAVDQAASVAAAVEKLETNAYDLVITDIMMPEKTGISLSEYIRKQEVPTPVLVVSGCYTTGQSGDIFELAQYFADGILSKPYDQDEFLKTVERLATGISARRSMENL